MQGPFSSSLRALAAERGRGLELALALALALLLAWGWCISDMSVRAQLFSSPLDRAVDAVVAILEAL